jgi:hypothetical protein
MPFNRHARLNEARLLQENVILGAKLLKANAELRMKIVYCERLELALHQRNEMIDALHGRIDQLRQRNKQLESEADHLATLIAAPPVDAAMLAPKPVDNL